MEIPSDPDRVARVRTSDSIVLQSAQKSPDLPKALSELAKEHYRSVSRVSLPSEDVSDANLQGKRQNLLPLKLLPLGVQEESSANLERKKSKAFGRRPTLAPEDAAGGLRRVTSSGTGLFNRSVNSYHAIRPSLPAFPPPPRVLRYGDVFTLRQEQKRRYLFCDGFVNSACEASIFDEHNWDASRFEDALFVICRSMQYTARKALQAAQQYLDEILARDDGTMQSAQDDIKKAREALESAKREADAEVKQNQEEYRRNVGTEVLYGASVQLRHLKTGKWLTLRFNEPAKEERCLLCVLDPDGGKGSWLSLMPAYKTRIEGERVRDADPVVLVSLSKGLYVHTTSLEMDTGTTREAEPQEVNASDDITRWVVHFYSSHVRNGDAGLNAGDKFRLYHREAEGYLVYEPVAWLPESPTRLEKEDLVPCSDHVFLKVCPSASDAGSNSLWEVEPEEYTRGVVAKWKQLYRIRHVATGKYLAPSMEDTFDSEEIEPDAVELKKLYSPLSCLFSFYPLDTAEKSIRIGRAGSLFKVQHYETHHWLNTMDEAVVSRARHPTVGRHKSCSQRISFSKKLTAADAYCVEVAEPSESLALAFVSSSLRALRQYSVKLLSNAATLQDQAQACDVLRVLLLFCKKSSKCSPSFLGAATITNIDLDEIVREAPSRKAQKLLFEQKALDILIDVVISNFDLGGGPQSLTDLPKDPHLHQVVRLSFMLIRTIIRDRPEFGSFLVRHSDMLFQQMSYGVFADKVLWEMYHDNSTLLMRDMGKYIRTVVHELKASAAALADAAQPKLAPSGASAVLQLTDKAIYGDLARFLSFLQLACSCKHEALPDNQEVIYELVFRDPELLKVLPVLSLNSSNQVVVSSPLIAGRVAVPLHDLLIPRLDSSMNGTSQPLFARKDTVFRKAPAGANFLRFFENYILFLARVCMGRFQKCMELIAGGSQPLVSKAVCQSCLLDDMLPSAARAAFCDLAIHLFVDAPPHREQQLITYTRSWANIAADGMTATSTPRADRLGIMEFEDVQHVIEDFPPAGQSGEPIRRAGSSSNPFTSRTSFSSTSSQPDSGGVFVVAALRLVRARIQFGCLVSGRSGNVEREVRSWYDTMFRFLSRLASASWDSTSRGPTKRSLSLFGEAKAECCRILILLHKMMISDEITVVLSTFKQACSYDQVAIAESSSQARLVEMLIRPQSDSQDDVNVLLSLLLDSNDALVASVLQLILHKYTVRRGLRQALERVRLLTSDSSIRVYERTSELMALVRLKNSNRLTLETVQDLTAAIQELSMLCLTPSGEANHTNQHILANADAYTEILAVLSLTDETQRSRHLDWLSAVRLLVDSILSFFTEFCKGNYEHQLLVFHDIDVLLGPIVTDSYVAACHCIMEVLRDNDDLCQKVTLNHVRCIADGIYKVGRKPIFLKVLMALVMLHGRPVRFNQKLVFKVAMERAKFIFPHFGDSPEVAAVRADLIRRQHTKHHTDVASDLIYFTESVNLMAKCSLGKNFDVESLCQRMLPCDECVATIKDAAVNPMVKHAYLEFFLQIYLDTERPVRQVLSGGVVWDVLDYLTHTVDTYADSCCASVDTPQPHLPNTPVPPGPISNGNGVPSTTAPLDASGDFILTAIVPFVSRVMTLPFSSPEDILANRLPVLDKLVRSLKRMNDMCAHVSGRSALDTCISRVKATRDGDMNRHVKQTAEAAHDSVFASRKAAQSEDDRNIQLQHFVADLFTAQDESKDFGRLVHFFETEVPLESIADSDMKKQQSSKFGRARSSKAPSLDSPNAGPKVRVLDRTLVATLIRIVSKGGSAADVDSAQLRVNVLRLLRRAMYIKPDSVLDDEHETEESIEDNVSISRERQDLLASCHAPELIVRLISEDCEAEVKRNCLKLGVWMLNGGNHVAQDAFYRAITNLKSGNFFEVLRQMLRRAAVVLKEQKHIQSRRRKHPFSDEDGADFLSAGSQKATSAVVEAKKNTSATSVVEDVRWILVLLQQFCEGRNKVFQDYIRSQKGSVKSIDMCFETVKYMHELERFIQPSTLESLVQSFETLTDFMNGPNPANQQLITSALGGFETVNHVFKLFNSRRADTAAFDMKTLVSAKDNLTKLLLTLLEGTPDIAVVTRMCTSLDFVSIVDNMRMFHEASMKAGDASLRHQHHRPLFSGHLSHLGRCGQDEMFNSEVHSLALAFQGHGEELLSAGHYMYILLKTLLDSSSSLPQPILDKMEEVFVQNEQQVFFHAYESRSARVEVVIHDKLQRLYFPIPSICAYLEKGRRLQLAKELKRDSPSTKIDDLFGRAPDLLREMEIKHSLHRNSMLRLLASQRFFFLLKYISFVVTIVQNFRLLVTFDDNWPSKTEMTTFLAVLQVLLTSGLLIIYLLQNWKLIMSKGYDLGKNHDWFDKQDTWDTMTQRRGLLGLFVDSIYFVGRKPYVWYLIFSMAIAILGTVNDRFFTFHLIDIVYRSSTLRYVFGALAKIYSQLIAMLLFGVLVVYMFAIIGYTAFPQDYAPSGLDTTGETTYCTDFVRCWFFSLWGAFTNGNQFFTQDVAILDIWNTDRPHAIGRFLFDTVFYIIFGVLVLNIVFGIMIDAFGDIRDRNREIDEDIHNRCYICNYDRDTLDRDGQGFERHIREDHNMWHYVYFLIHLINTPSTQYFGPESFIASKIASQVRDWSFAPTNRALCVEDKAKARERNQQEVLASLTSKLQDIVDKIDTTSALHHPEADQYITHSPPTGA